MTLRLMRRSVLSSALLAVALIAFSLPSSAAPGLTENELKAIFLLRLSQFVSWPDEQSARIFCIAPASELATLLQEIVASEPGDREVRPLISHQVNGCDVVFASFSDNAEEMATAKGVLWVSDQPGFARKGGMIELKRTGARMKLVINLEVLESAGLRASSKLLQLSELVGDLSSDA